MDEQKMKVIWIVSYPKSGNTWIRTLLRNYIEKVYGTKPTETNDSVPYYYHTVSPTSVVDLSHNQIAQLRPAAMMHLIGLNQSRTHPTPALLIKSHMCSAEFSSVPLFSSLWADKVIYIYRDPRDILPSYADHTGKTHQETIDLMNSPKAYVGDPPAIPSVTSTWSAHVLSWIDNGRVDTLMISYEKIYKDPYEVMKSVVEFCDFEIDIDAIDHAVQGSEFSYLAAAEREDGFVEKSVHSEKFFRRGIVGSHKDECDDISIARLENDHGEAMKRFGYLPESKIIHV